MPLSLKLWASGGCQGWLLLQTGYSPFEQKIFRVGFFSLPTSLQGVSQLLFVTQEGAIHLLDPQIMGYLVESHLSSDASPLSPEDL